VINKPKDDTSEGDSKEASQTYRGFVGPSDKYDLVGAMQFILLTFLGLREDDYLLDIGCGSLRAGRLFIPYLLPGRYFGIEPEKWLIDEAIKNEIGDDIVRIKQPVFSNDTTLTLSVFNQKFDFILAQSIFSHASQKQIRRCLSEARKVMKPTSIFAATFMKGETNYTGDEWVYPSAVTYTPEHMKSLVEEQGLACEPIDWPHPNLQTWMVIFNPENKKNIPNPDDIGRLLLLEYEKGYKERLSSLKERLSRKEKRLSKLQERLSIMERNPYVRLGLRISGFIQRIKKERY